MKQDLRYVCFTMRLSVFFLLEARRRRYVQSTARQGMRVAVLCVHDQHYVYLAFIPP